MLQNLDLVTILIQVAALLFSLSIHEASHAWMADRLGDYTARYLGRVTLNPIAHIDPVGTLLFPLLLFLAGSNYVFGWAKPVPVNPVHLKNPQRDQIYISIAGPGSNLLAGAVSLVLLVGLKLTSPNAEGLLMNIAITFKVPQQETLLAPILGLLFFSLIINLALALFNLLPVPPLDGHWVLYGLMPYKAAQMMQRYSGFGIIILYGLMIMGILQYLFIPIGWVLNFLLHL